VTQRWIFFQKMKKKPPRATKKMSLSSTSTAGVAARRDIRWRWGQFRTGMTQPSSIITMHAVSFFLEKERKKTRAEADFKARA
jgi:hypothetical protein